MSGPSKVTILRHALPPGTPDDSVKALLDSHFIGLLTSDALGELLDLGATTSSEARTVIASKEHPADQLMLVVRGHAKEYRTATDGNEILLNVLGPGDLVGTLPVTDGPPAIADVESLSPVDVLVVPGSDLRKLLTSSPVAATAFLRQLAFQLRIERWERVEATAHDSRVRVGRRIVELADRWGEEIDGAVVIALSLSQEELGAWAGVSREATVKTLAEFRSRGWIETGRRWIRVTDLGSVRRRARWQHLPNVAGTG